MEMKILICLLLLSMCEAAPRRGKPQVPGHSKGHKGLAHKVDLNSVLERWIDDYMEKKYHGCKYVHSDSSDSGDKCNPVTTTKPKPTTTTTRPPTTTTTVVTTTHPLHHI